MIAIAAVGVSLAYGILRLVNFAHGDYLTFGAFVGDPTVAELYLGGASSTASSSTSTSTPGGMNPAT